MTEAPYALEVDKESLKTMRVDIMIIPPHRKVNRILLWEKLVYNVNLTQIATRGFYFHKLEEENCLTTKQVILENLWH